MSSESEYSSDEGDRELQLALDLGHLSNGLNVQQDKRRPVINKEEQLLQKLQQISKKRPWLDTLSVCFSPEFAYTSAVSNDLEREAQFKKQARSAIAVAFPRLNSMKVPIFRPHDYLAEMAKSDAHMRKVRERLLGVQKEREKREAAVRLREEKKFAVEVQKARKADQHKEKRMLTLAVKNHRRGDKTQLEHMLGNDGERKMQGRGAKNRKGTFCDKARGKKQISRTARNKKYGFGGPRKKGKRNDKASFDDVGRRPKFVSTGQKHQSAGGQRIGQKRK